MVTGSRPCGLASPDSTGSDAGLKPWVGRRAGGPVQETMSVGHTHHHHDQRPAGLKERVHQVLLFQVQGIVSGLTGA
jgi:hypothetical protein